MSIKRRFSAAKKFAKRHSRKVPAKLAAMGGLLYYGTKIEGPPYEHFKAIVEANKKKKYKHLKFNFCQPFVKLVHDARSHHGVDKQLGNVLLFGKLSHEYVVHDLQR